MGIYVRASKPRKTAFAGMLAWMDCAAQAAVPLPRRGKVARKEMIGTVHRGPTLSEQALEHRRHTRMKRLFNRAAKLSTTCTLTRPPAFRLDLELD